MEIASPCCSHFIAEWDDLLEEGVVLIRRVSKMKLPNIIYIDILSRSPSRDGFMTAPLTDCRAVRPSHARACNTRTLEWLPLQSQLCLGGAVWRSGCLAAALIPFSPHKREVIRRTGASGTRPTCRLLHLGKGAPQDKGTHWIAHETRWDTAIGGSLVLLLVLQTFGNFNFRQDGC